MAEPGKPTTVIGADTHIKGDMTFESTARILGTFEGRIVTKGEVQIAEGSSCRATIEAAKVLLDASVEGNVTARERMELTAKARLKGDLIATRLVIAEGAALNGHVSVGPDASKSAKPLTLDLTVETKPDQRPELRPVGGGGGGKAEGQIR